MNTIEIRHLTKIYRLYSSPKDRLHEIFSIRRKKIHHKFYALQDISFDIEQGKTIGIIGMNGSGKSTLLKVIAGVSQPTTGTVNIIGRVSALLELGSGFDPEFSGRENVLMNGALMGMSQSEVEKRFDEIEAFAGIGDFIDQPVKTYSSGMFVRLAFAAAMSVDPDILVIDEALSVGDTYFQHKCIARIDSFRETGKTVLLVTHDVNFAKSFCDEVILLHEGAIIERGEPEYVTEQYLRLVHEKQTQYASSDFQIEEKAQTKLAEAKTSFGSKAGQILNVKIVDNQFRETVAILSGSKIVVKIQARIKPSVKNPSISIILRDHRGVNVYGTSTAMQSQRVRPDDCEHATVFFSMEPKLRAGSYSLVVSLDESLTPKINTLIDRQVAVGAFRVIEDKTEFLGIVDLEARAFQLSSIFYSNITSEAPVVIGAMGGSGTRVVARCVKAAGYFIGTKLNMSEDALDFVEFYDRWINRFIDRSNNTLTEVEKLQMRSEFENCLTKHLGTIEAKTDNWGWKEPRSIYLLPFIHDYFPEVKFIHVVRDGRDMAFSANQNQLHKHGCTVLDKDTMAKSQPIQSILLWNQINLIAAEYGERNMGDNYLRIRFEDLCRNPKTILSTICRFLGSKSGIDINKMQEGIAFPNSIGRWQNHADSYLESEIHRSAEEGLIRFGYLQESHAKPKNDTIQLTV